MKDDIIKSLISKYPFEDIKDYETEIIKIIDNIKRVVEKHKYSFIDEITDVIIPATEIKDWIFVKRIFIDHKDEMIRLIRSTIYRLTNYGMSVRYSVTDSQIHVMLILIYDDNNNNKNIVI